MEKIELNAREELEQKIAPSLSWFIKIIARIIAI
jgi:hypothetical protein